MDANNKLREGFNIDVEELAAKPWKYIGYDQYSQFLASDNDFIVLRRFGALHVRVLLALQDEITTLENRLAELDRTASDPKGMDNHNGTFRHDQVKERSSLLNIVKRKLREYDDFMSKTSHLRTLSPARQQDADSVKTWLFNNNDPIKGDEVAYLDHRADLIPLVPKARSSLRNLAERWSTFRLSSLWRVRDPQDRAHARLKPTLHQEKIIYTSDQRIENCLAALILFCGLVMLISPLWILHCVTDKGRQLGIITAYIIAFTGLLSFSTVAKPFESLAAAAAYSAVLMVFLQIS